VIVFLVTARICTVKFLGSPAEQHALSFLLEGAGEINDIAGIFKTPHNTKCVSAEQLVPNVFSKWNGFCGVLGIC